MLILVDEVQEHPATAAAAVRAGCRASQDETPLGVVLAGLPSAISAVINEVSYAERIPAVGLDALEPDEAFDAIARPMRVHGVELPEQYRPHVHTVTGGYPFFVQVLGRDLWFCADVRERISSSAWKKAVTATSTRTDQWLTDRFARIPARGQRYLVAGNRVGWPAATGAVAKELGVPHQEASPARAALVSDGVLWVPERGQVSRHSEPGWTGTPPEAGDVRSPRCARNVQRGRAELHVALAAMGPYARHHRVRGESQGVP